ncbi:MAG: hypothetical protein ABFD92_11245 [Planctomycetaceae bacterium]|nr:hypothetical protein [Planctomycetaceae bacterium]
MVIAVSLAAAALFAAGDAVAPVNRQANPYAQWRRGPVAPAAANNYFPIAVWLQQPKNAAKFKAAGINLYIGLWKGPTDKQLAELTGAGMPVICDQNAVGLKHVNDPIIVGWMHGDEPDNAQALPGGKGYGPPIRPEKVRADYQRMIKADPTRPVLLNLGQGVAYDDYIGRGVRRGRMEDYPQYVRGCDIVSFDIYPAVHDKPAIAGKLEMVPRGVDRLRTWGGDGKVVWNCIECTRISNTRVKPTPAQVRSEVWMSIIHGSRGLIYFVHQFKPTFIEAGLLADAEMLAAVTKINARIAALAPVLNSPSVEKLVTVTSSDAAVPIDIMVKKLGKRVYVLAAAMRGRETTGAFRIEGLGAARATVLDEERTVNVTGGGFSDEFKGYQVHLYEIE